MQTEVAKTRYGDYEWVQYIEEVDGKLKAKDDAPEWAKKHINTFLTIDTL